MTFMTYPTPGTDPQSTLDPSPEEVDVSRSPQPVEVAILAEVYDAAKDRAHAQGQTLAAVARTVLFQEAAKAPEDAVPPAGRPPLREYGQERRKLKFSAPNDAYREAQRKILSGGRSVAAAIEDGLKAFALSGRL